MRLKRRRTLEVHQPEALVREAGSIDAVQPAPLALIDDALRRFVSRRVVTSAEIVDLLLDMRSAVVLDTTFATFLHELEMR